ncbi:hypothetical protein [Azospirillum sp. sgz302134]
MSIDRTELERLLADRPTGNRSAMQAVRESYGDISLMRERGLSWAEISDILAKLGITARDNQPISPVTLRSAFFLVGNEGRGGTSAEEGGESTTPRETLDAVHRAALASGRTAEADSLDVVGEEMPEAELSPEGEEVTALPEPAVEEPPVADATVDSSAPTAEPEEEPAVEETVSDESDATAAPTESQATESSAAEIAPAKIPEAKIPEAEIPEAEIPEAEIPVTEIPAAEIPMEIAPEPVAEAPLPVEEPEPIAPPSEPAEAPAISAAPAPLGQPISHVSISQTPISQDLTTNRLWKGDRMLGTIFVLNDRGGVGKTLLSHHLMATAMLEGLQLKVVEYEVNERLNRLFGPEVVEHRRITQDFMNMMGSGDGFYEFWDQIGPELQRGGRLYDFGGNISQWFFNWAEVSGFDYYVGDGERLTFMVPVTVDLASLSTGMNTLERIATIAPKAKRVLVENGFSGPFSQLEDSQYARRKAEMVEREGVEVISMSPCTAPAWARLTGHRLDHVAQMTREDLVKLGMTPPVASRSLIIIHEWLRNMRQSLSPYLRDAFNQTAGAPAKAGAR